MAGRRTYGEACGLAHALDLVGERWALLVVRELVLGPKRFSDLRAGIVHVSPNVLSERLRDLEQVGVVRRRKLGPPVSAMVYELSEWGLELGPVLSGLGRWGARSPSHCPDIGMSVDSHVLALRTLFDGARAEGLDATYELRLGDDTFTARVRDGAFTVDRGVAGRADATIAAEPSAFAAVLWGGVPRADGGWTVAGDAGAVERFLTLFPLPDKAPAVAA